MASLTTVESSGAARTWHEVYENQSISEVKVLEKQLRSSILRDKEKLRVLVGGSYRELLSTADEIVALETRSRATETHIAQLSAQCKPPEVSSASLTSHHGTAIAAQLRLLSHCTLCATDLLRSRSLLLSAQLCLIARLLLKSLATLPEPPLAIERLRHQTDGLRQKLLHRVNVQLVNPRSSLKSITEAVCAFSLVKSVTAIDAIEHFQDLRLSKLRQRFDGDIYDIDSIKESFRYLVMSVRSLRLIHGRGINDILTNIQQQPILEDPVICRMEILELNALRTLIPSDVLAFTPYVKRMALERDDVHQTVERWITEASKIASVGLSSKMTNVKKVAEVLKLRKGLLDIVLPVYFSSNAQDMLLQNIRSVVNRKLLELCKKQNENMLQIVQTVLSHSSEDTASTSLWDESFIQRPVVTNNSDFLQQVQSRHLGTKGSLDRGLKRLRSWTKSHKLLRSQLKEIRQLRWQDVIEEPDEGEEEAAVKVIKTLVEVDPSTIETAIDTTMKETLSTLESQIEERVSVSLSEGSSTTTTQAVFLLRALRESLAIVVQAVPDHKFDLSTVYTKLHQVLVAEVLRRLQSKVQDERHLSSGSVLAAVGLPSPRCFSALRSLGHIMSDIGGADTWSSEAVALLKSHLREEMLSAEKKQSYTENEFDEHYLGAALKASSQEDAESSNSNVEAALAYWNRTKLLFGVLSQ